MAQTTYTTLPALALAGMYSDTSPRSEISRASESATAVEFGRPVVVGTDPATQFLLPSAAGQVFLGVTVRHADKRDPDASDIIQDEVAGLCRQGYLWVTVEEAVVGGDPVYFRHTTSGPLVPGGWRNDADTATADLLPGAVYMTAAAIDSLAIIQFNLP